MGLVGYVSPHMQAGMDMGIVNAGNLPLYRFLGWLVDGG